MTERSLIIKSVYTADGGEDDAAAARARRKESFPGRSARRMTHLGMLADLCLRDLASDAEMPLIYASAFAESASLEAFIESFPHASPMLFQTSIHPSAVEQSMILRKRPVNRFYPITSNDNLAGKALECALTAEASTVALVGGEERGGWLCPFELASAVSFAFAFELADRGEGLGRVAFESGHVRETEPGVDLEALYGAARDRTAIAIPSFGLGGWIRVKWT